MACTDLLSKIYDELDARLRELRPLVDEYESLLDAAAALSSRARRACRWRARPGPRSFHGDGLRRRRSLHRLVAGVARRQRSVARSAAEPASAPEADVEASTIPI